MYEFVKRRVILDTPDKNSSTKRKHYISLSKQKATLPDEITRGENFRIAETMLRADYEYTPPGVLAMALNSFWDLRHTKPIDECIAYTDIKAYVDLLGLSLHPREVKLIMSMDNIYRQQYYKENT